MAIVLQEDKGTLLTAAEADNNIKELRDLPDGKTFPKTRGVGIKIDTNAPEFGWHDIIGQLHVYGDIGDAHREVYLGGIKALQFPENDSAFIDFHMPHDYAPETPIYIHVHWSHNSALVTGGSCTWGFEAIYAKGHDQAAFQVPIVATVLQDQGGQHQHMIAETIMSDNGGSAVTFDTNILEVDGIIQCRLFLDSNDMVTSDASVVEPFAHFVDIHYQSTGIATKNKSPDFYT